MNVRKFVYKNCGWKTRFDLKYEKKRYGKGIFEALKRKLCMGCYPKKTMDKS